MQRGIGLLDKDGLPGKLRLVEIAFSNLFHVGITNFIRLHAQVFQRLTLVGVPIDGLQRWQIRFEPDPVLISKSFP